MRAVSVIATVVGGLMIVGAAVWLVLSVGAGQQMNRGLVAVLVLGVIALGAVFSVRFEAQSRARAQHTRAQVGDRLQRHDGPSSPDN